MAEQEQPTSIPIEARLSVGSVKLILVVLTIIFMAFLLQKKSYSGLTLGLTSIDPHYTDTLLRSIK